ncbi:MAG: hypothetical protein Q8O67_33730 [Deltaproteobacteria bacterium]|nr:hypothetical protein [Deltaproteobacteria bacterium]
MTTPQALMIVALFVVAVIYVKSRIGGALATAGWCVAAAFFGAWALGQREDGVIFLGIQTPKWIYYAVIGSIFLYHCSILVRAFSRRVVPKPAAPETTTTTPPADS